MQQYHYSGLIHSEDPTHEEQHLTYTIPQLQCKLYAPSASSILHHSCDCRRSDHDTLMFLSWDTHPPLWSIVGKLLEHCLRRRMNHHYCSSLTFVFCCLSPAHTEVWVIEITQEWPSVSGKNWRRLRIKSIMSLGNFMKDLCHLTLYIPYKTEKKRTLLNVFVSIAL